MSPTGSFSRSGRPPWASIRARVASMSSTSMTTTGTRPTDSSRSMRPPLMNPGSVGPVSGVGPVLTMR